MINYSLSYRNVKVADLDANGNKQYDSNGDVVKKTVQKAYATQQSITTLTNDEFCKAVAAMGAYSKADIMSVVTVLAKNIAEQVKLGQRVYLGELGNFYPSLTSKGVENADDFAPATHIKKAYVGWARPTGMRELSDVTYNLVATHDAQAAVTKASKAALTTATLSQSAATQAAAQNLTIIRADYLITTTTGTNMASMGSVTGGGTYHYGTKVGISATPNEGYVFTKWSDGSRQKEREVTVTAAKTYTALFAADPQITATNLVKSDNSVLAAGDQVTALRLNFTATAAPADNALTLVKLVNGTETALEGAEWSSDSNSTGTFTFESAYVMTAGTYRVLKGDYMILELTLS